MAAIDQQKLSTELIFAGRGTLTELSDDLGLIAPIEGQTRKRIAALRWQAAGVFVLAITAAMTLSGYFFMPGLLIAAGLLIYSFVLSNSGIVHDRVEYLRLLLNMLSHDSDPKSRFRVSVALRKNVRKVSEGPHPVDRYGKQIFFRDEWFSCTGKLRDGTLLSASLADTLQKKKKRGSSGKMKTKVNCGGLLSIQLDYNAEKYGDVCGAAKKLRVAYRLSGETRIKSFKCSASNLTVKTSVKEKPLASNLYAATEATLLGSYRILNLARHSMVSHGGAK